MSSADLTPLPTIQNEDVNQNQVNQIIDLHIEEIRTKFDKTYRDFVGTKLSQVRDFFCGQLEEIHEDLS